MNIDYRKLAHAYSHYMRLGYKYIDVPWFVSNKATYTTLPSDRSPFTTKFGDLVGSGEQSFVQLMLDNKLEPGKYMCVTPCFRDEAITEYNHINFMKLELINTMVASKASIDEIVADAMDFYEFYVEGHRTKKVVDSSCTYGYTIDIVSADDIELGSYGAREAHGLKWTFGTGLAEPRLSQAIKDEA